MKTLSGTFAFVALAVIAIVTLPSCCKQVSKEADKKFYLEFRGPPDKEYLEVKQPDFDNALCALKANEASVGKPKPYKIKFKADDKATPDDDYDPPSCPPVSINTDKITTSGVARTEPVEEFAAYDPKATHYVKSNKLTDIERVLDAFEDK
jgi:hypothetical protein